MGKIDSSNNVLLFYPPGKLYQRGEDRSQGNVEDSTATSVRAPNDLCYVAADLKRIGFVPIVRDYQSTKADLGALLADVEKFRPVAVFISVTNATIFSDLACLAEIKKRCSDCMIMVKGSLFFDPDDSMLAQLDLEHADYLLGMESDYIVGKLVRAHFTGMHKICDIPGLLYRNEGAWKKTSFTTWKEDLDDFPFPDRTAIDNTLYVRPDTNEPQATIVTSRGCPAACTYCLTPRISGKKLRMRSPASILCEMVQCYDNHGIRNFFFKSDTFTFDHKWVVELCTGILRSPLKNKIEWVANSRTRPLRKESLAIMREAGCWLTAFGYESGHPETLNRIRKGTTVDDNQVASSWAKEAGLKIFGFFMMGFPWEGWEHLNATRKHIFELDSDFIELHLTIPYFNTELYNQAVEAGTVIGSVFGGDYFNPPSAGTKFITQKELINYRKKILMQYHLRPSYIIKKVSHQLGHPRVLCNYAKFGLRLIRNSMK